MINRLGSSHSRTEPVAHLKTDHRPLRPRPPYRDAHGAAGGRADHAQRALLRAQPPAGAGHQARRVPAAGGGRGPAHGAVPPPLVSCRSCYCCDFVLEGRLVHENMHMHAPRSPRPSLLHRTHVTPPIAPSRPPRPPHPPCNPQLDLSLEELKTRFKRHSVTATMQCTGNRRNEFNASGERPVKGLEWDGGSISTAVRGPSGPLDGGVLRTPRVLWRVVCSADAVCACMLGGAGRLGSRLPVRKEVSLGLCDGNDAMCCGAARRRSGRACACGTC